MGEGIPTSNQDDSEDRARIMEGERIVESSVRRVSVLFSQSIPSRISVDLSKEEKPTEKRKYTRTEWITLATLALGNFCVGACVALQAPFFPKEATKKGATATEYGLIFGVYELTIFATAPFMGKLMTLMPPKFIMNSGLFVVGVTCICFGTLDYIMDRKTFIGLAFAIRIMEGVGASSSQTACFVIIAAAFPNNMATTFAVLETFLGLGLITGPTVGGALFDVGGYGLPFYAMGSLMVLNSIVILFALPSPEQASNTEKANLLKFWLHPVTLVYGLVIFSALNYIGFNQATLEPHLRQFNLSGFYLGLIFALAGTLYAITAPFWGWLCDKKFDAKVICMVGSLITIVSLLLIGPMPFLNIKSGIGVTLAALALKGTALGAKFICAFSGSLTDTMARGYPNDLVTYGLVSSLFATTQSFGAFVGPSLGGFLLDHVGYDGGTVAVLILELTVMLILIVYTFASRRRQKKPQESTDEEKQPVLQNGGNHALYTKEKE